MSLFSRFPQPYSFHHDTARTSLGSLKDHALSWAGQWLSPLDTLRDRFHDLIDSIRDALHPTKPSEPETPAAPGISIIDDSGLVMGEDSASIRGVFGDPTDPALTQGIAFGFSDADTPRDQLTVSVTSSDDSVARAALDDDDVLHIAPITKGTATITVAVSDGEQESTYVIDYAAADGSDTNNSARFHTGASDTSAAITIGDGLILVGDDEDQTLRLYDHDRSGAPLKSFDLNDALGLEEGDEIDIESVVENGDGIYYWLGSLAGGERSTIFATRITGDDADSLKVEMTGQFSGLDAAIAEWAAVEAPELNLADGFEVEGATWRDGTLYLGVRQPIGDDGRASVVTVTNIDELMDQGSADGAEFGEPLRLDMDGRTIRDIQPIGDGSYLISAGPAEEDDNDASNDDFQLYRWDGAHKVALVEGVDLNTNADATTGTAETLSNIQVHADGSVSVDVEYDNGTSDWSGSGTESKDLDEALQTFTSSTLTIDQLPDFEPAQDDMALVSAGDGFSFVALEPITPGATLTFTSAGASTTWTAPKSGVAAGQVIDSSAQADQFSAPLAVSLDAGLTIQNADGDTLYRLGINDDSADISLPAGTQGAHYAGVLEGEADALLEAIGQADDWQPGNDAVGSFTINTGHAPLPPPTPQDLGIAISEIWPGQSGSDITEDWFEITNTGETTLDFTQTPLYYDDDSANPDEAAQVQGLTTLAPGAAAIVMVDGDSEAVDTFRQAWSNNADLEGVEIGYTGSAAGLGSGGDQVTLWLGKPGRDTLAAQQAYPDTEAFDAASWDVIAQRFTDLNSGGTQSSALGGDDETPAIATPGQVTSNDSEAPPATGTLLISEYVEGSGYNKAIELANDSGATLSLTGYSLSLYANGNSSATSRVDLGQYGELAAGETLVLANSQADDDLLARSDATSGVINFNGNDALQLTDADGTVVDVVGTVGDTESFAQDVTLRRQDSVTSGSDSFDPEQWETLSQDSIEGLGVRSGDSANDDGAENDGENDGDTGDQDEGDDMEAPPVELISTIQGSGMQSALAGQRVSVEAIVTMDARDGLSGFFVQEEEADQDGDDATSEGLFVYLQDGQNAQFDDISVGDRVRLSGTVEEYEGKTELTDLTALEVTGTDQALPDAAELTLPMADKSTLAAFESMRVSIEGEDSTPLTVTDTYELGRYGSVTLSSGGRLAQFTEQNAPDQAGHQQWLDQIESRSIVLDDASSAQNPGEIIFGRNGAPLSADNTLRGGDTLDQLNGVLDFSYQQWRVQSTDGQDFQATNERTEAPDAQALGDASLKVASFNVLNYFNTLDADGNEITTPGGIEHTPRGANSEVELGRQQDKLVSAISASDADVVGLMEVANDGYGEDSAIATLVSALNAYEDDNGSNGGDWAWTTPRDDNGDIVAPGTDAIAVGMIYRADSVTPEGEAAINTSGAFAYGNRAPMLQTFQDDDSQETFSVAVNHFKSKGSVIDGEEAIGDGQGNNNPTRVEAAEQLAAWIETDPTDSGDSDVLIVGDLNSYAMEDPITALRDEGYTLLDDDYSYSFDGQWGSLDHALASASMNDQVTGTTTWHINADEPTVLDYNTEYKSDAQIDTLYSDDIWRASDHDPIIIGIDPGSDNQQAAGF